MNPRPFVEDDAPGVAALISAEEERFYGRPGRVTGADILMFRQWSKEEWVWEADGSIVASATYGMHGDAANTRGVVADKGRGMGTEILERGEAFARAEGAKKILTGAPEPDDAARALSESRGYREVRRFYEMAIELTEEPPEPELPTGFVVDELRDDEYEIFFEVLNESFAEHWEWHPDPFEEWLERRKGQHRDEHGPVWFVVRDGDEFAGVTRNDVSVAGGAYVGAIGVRPAWRAKGVAKACCTGRSPSSGAEGRHA
jgi:GNAT superfamily N-acetyltransferase